jgi:hypothetical protein
VGEPDGHPVGSPVMTEALRRSVGRTVARHPSLWWTALGALRRLAAPGWWGRRPYLPLPDERLWAFRMVTAYGSPDAEPTQDDVVSYLEWCRGERRGRSGHRPSAAVPARTRGGGLSTGGPP